ncbi:hypothetical protein MPTK1_4g05610 [Marchantia polymorpha subsp. ruderalis]|uniref:Uncharacterized protein n=2 Tax=Marchantia polymorpha TaxID=3197 RepID=A0AAF6B6Q0_MARPO|nr:hypothetical protein MARPO_0087s0030 [Marchantia polymorpha]BBN07684.1 hypothetical protein Mp_4g05610 [Marchantia polymorpha subsp. ruderalis]|eukprot:PTQ33589.1 hypothetical protein MARPO_0087s0030 [Marchantia polymorpha]
MDPYTYESMSFASGSFIWEATEENFDRFCARYGSFSEAVLKGEDYRKVYEDDVAEYLNYCDFNTKTVRGRGHVVFFDSSIIQKVKTLTGKNFWRRGEYTMDITNIPGPKWMIVDGLLPWLQFYTASTMSELMDATIEDLDFIDYFDSLRFIPEIRILEVLASPEHIASPEHKGKYRLLI